MKKLYLINQEGMEQHELMTSARLTQYAQNILDANEPNPGCRVKDDESAIEIINNYMNEEVRTFNEKGSDILMSSIAIALKEINECIAENLPLEEDAWFSSDTQYLDSVHGVDINLYNDQAINDSDYRITVCRTKLNSESGFKEFNTSDIIENIYLSSNVLQELGVQPYFEENTRMTN